MSKASFNFFKAPKFLTFPSVAVEITSAGIFYLNLKKNKLGFLPYRYGFIPLAPGAVVHNDLVNKEELIKALNQVQIKTGCRFARLTLPEERTYIFKTELPALSETEIQSVLDFKLEENIPLPIKDIIFDYEILPNKNGGSIQQVIVSATSAKLVDELVDIFKRAKLEPIIFSPEARNVARALIRPNNQQSLIIVNICNLNIVFSWVVDGEVLQTSTVNFGSTTLNELLAKYYKVPVSEVGKIKKEKLFSDNVDNMEVFSYLINSFSALKDELYQFLVFCNEREGNNRPIEKIILAGQDALFYNLNHYLSDNLDLPVEIGNVWLNNFNIEKYVPDINRVDAFNFLSVNGLNLLDYD